MAELRILPPTARFLKKLKDKKLKTLYKEAIDETVVIIMAGTRENFYEQLKRYWN